MSRFYRMERSEAQRRVRALVLQFDRQEIAMLAYQQAEVRAFDKLFGNKAACDQVALQIVHRIIEER